MKLYVSRKVLNAKDIHKWFELQSVEQLEDEKELHITQVYSREDVNIDDMVFDKNGLDLTMENSTRKIEFFGEDKNVLVMTCKNKMMDERFKYFESFGCSFDYDNYTSHITLSFGDNTSKELMIFPGLIQLGPEIWEPIKE